MYLKVTKSLSFAVMYTSFGSSLPFSDRDEVVHQISQEQYHCPGESELRRILVSGIFLLLHFRAVRLAIIKISTSFPPASAGVSFKLIFSTDV